MIWRGAVRRGKARQAEAGAVWIGGASPAPVRCGRCGEARDVKSRSALACPGQMWQASRGRFRRAGSGSGMARLGTLWQASRGTVWRGVVGQVVLAPARASCGSVWCGRRGLARYGQARCGRVGSGELWQARLGQVRQGTARQGTPRYGRLAPVWSGAARLALAR